MPVFDRYLFKNLVIATVFTAMALAGVILLTQSLRFLELVINAGASGGAFWILTLLALPRFFEVILPVALMAATVFVYNRMTMDSELTVMRALGASPLRLARPALMLALGVTLTLWFMMMWLAPTTLSGMQQMRQVIKAQYSTLLFREGVFTSIRPGVTAFVRARGAEGELRGLMIHDSRPENKTPVTIIAKSGGVSATPDGQQILVYDGSRQDINPQTGTLNRLDFKRYAIDLPDGSGPVRQRWREPEERTIIELLNPDMTNERDVKRQDAFRIEIHRRIISPLLAPAFTVMALAFLLLGAVERRGQGMRIAFAVAGAVGLQSLYMAAFNAAQDQPWLLPLPYILVFGPLLGGLYLMTGRGESLRARFTPRIARVAGQS